jgi:Eukaryotic DNA topoisomerase I, DNA binding fragment.
MNSNSSSSAEAPLVSNDSVTPDAVMSDDFEPKSSKSTSNTKKRKSSKKEDLSDSDDFQPKKSKTSHKKVKQEIKVKKETKVKKESGTKNQAKATGPKLKRLEKADRISHAMQSFLWWNAPDPPEGCQWQTMEHAGVSFTEPYVPHGIKMKYDGKDVDLNPVEEEA